MSDASPGALGRILLRVTAATLGALGLAMAAGGLRLALLGGSFYYLAAGGAITLSAVLLWRRRASGVRLYALMLAGTLAWSIHEVGLDLWALLPRLLVLTLFGLWLLAPWTRRTLQDAPPRQSKTAIAATGVALLAGGLGYASHALVVAPSLAPDPRFQTGMGAFPHSPSPEAAARGAQADWRSFGGDPGGSRFSALDQITPQNVAHLQPAWSIDAGGQPGAMATPLMVGGALYTCNGNEILAFDARSGAALWRHNASAKGPGRCRGVAYYAAPGAAGLCAARILVGVNSTRLIALDAKSGQPCPDFGDKGAVDLLQGMGDADGKVIPGYYRLTSPPAIVRGKAVVGGYISDNQYWGEPSGVIRAFDAVTGKLAWAWDVGRPDRSEAPAPGDNYTHSTPNSWAPMAADEALGRVYVPTGNPAPDLFGGMRRPFDERVGSAVVALDAATGREVWAFQTKHHDVWDRDVASPPALVDLRGPDGRLRPALVQSTKGGEVFVLDRVTGQPIFPVTERKAPQAGAVPEERLSPTQPTSDALPSFRGANLREADMWGLSPLDQLACRIGFRDARYEGPDTPVGLTTSIIAPSMFGAMNWGGVSIDPVNRVMVVASNRMASRVRLKPRAEADALGYRPEDEVTANQSRPRFGEPMARTPYGAERSYWLSALGIPCIAPPYGLISAVNLDDGKLIWTQRFGSAKGLGPMGLKFPIPVPMGTPNHGGGLITRSGLLIIGGTPDGYLHAFDVRSGDLLWRTELPGGGNAQPISYELGGKQYLVISAGGSAAIGAKMSTRLIAFALPDAAAR